MPRADGSETKSEKKARLALSRNILQITPSTLRGDESVQEPVISVEIQNPPRGVVTQGAVEAESTVTENPDDDANSVNSDSSEHSYGSGNSDESLDTSNRNAKRRMLRDSNLLSVFVNASAKEQWTDQDSVHPEDLHHGLLMLSLIHI